MKLIDIVRTLQSTGHDIKFRVRKDGGIIITSIDGARMTSLTQGSKIVREMTGNQLSEASLKQRQNNVKKYIKLNTEENKQKHKSSGLLDKEIDKLIKKAQKEYRKNKRLGQGKVTRKKVRWRLKNRGKEETIRYLEDRIRYSQGYANALNVEAVKQLLNRVGIGAKTEAGKSALQRINRIFEFQGDTIKESMIKEILEVYYRKDNNGHKMSDDDRLVAVEKILDKYGY